MIRGEAITAHMAKWLRCWVSLRLLPLPTSSMSGSGKCPGPAYPDSGALMLTMLRMPIGYAFVLPVSQEVVMSSVVRQMLETSPQLRLGPGQQWKEFGLMLKRIGRPVAAS